MKVKNILFTALIVSGFSGSAYAQYVNDAYLFSQQNNIGTARFKAMGSANTALGGDISSISGNPAGLGFFSGSDISITGNLNSQSYRSTFFGQQTKKNKTNFDIDNAGAVFHFKTYNDVGVLNFNVGVSYDKAQSFNTHSRYEGVNNANSIVNRYADMMASGNNGAWNDKVYDSFLVEEYGNNASDFFPLTKEAADKQQVNDVLSSGHQARTNFSFGLNINNKLYLGAGLGISEFNYEKSDQFSESGWTKDRASILANNSGSTVANPTHDDYQYVEANYELMDEQYQQTQGSGADFKIGAIYKPTLDWNIGASISSPTWFNIDHYGEEYIGVDYYDNEQATSAFSSFDINSSPTEQRYKLYTPWKYAAGITKFFGRGLITAQAEYTDHSTLKISELTPYLTNREDLWNKDIRDMYQGAFNFNIGGEYLLNQMFSGRLGYNHIGNALQQGDNSRDMYSLGLGARLTANIYLDLALTHQVNNSSSYAYIIDEQHWKSPSPTVDVKYQRTNMMLTIGTKF